MRKYYSPKKARVAYDNGWNAGDALD